MDNHSIAGGVPLGTGTPQMPEITVYPIAAVAVREGGLSLGDATHHLSIILPNLGKEIRLPYNAASLRRLAEQALNAAEQTGGQHVR